MGGLELTPLLSSPPTFANDAYNYIVLHKNSNKTFLEGWEGLGLISQVPLIIAYDATALITKGSD